MVLKYAYVWCYIEEFMVSVQQMLSQLGKPKYTAENFNQEQVRNQMHKNSDGQ